MFILSQKLNFVKEELKQWNKLVFGDVNQKVDDALAAVECIQQKTAVEGYSNDLHTQENVAQMDLQQALTFKYLFGSKSLG